MPPCNLTILAAAIAAFHHHASISERKRRRNVINCASPKRKRGRRSVEDIFLSMGCHFFKRAYRMSYRSFCHLVERVSPFMQSVDLAQARVNGPITDSVRIACSLRYFAGGSPSDIAPLFGIGHNDVLRSVWRVVDAVNKCSSFDIQYPDCQIHQREIASQFARRSGANFQCCAGAIDGILIWTHKPSKRCCEEAGCANGKFFCGRKSKFGLNCQAVADSNGRILDMSILYPGSTSDCLAFEGMNLFHRLENGLLAEELCLFGDNAYLNSPFMATPYIGAVGAKDAYNFFHSQLRISVECAFGMLTQRWGILRCMIPKNITLKKTVAMVMCVAKLHNFCIDERDLEIGTLMASDEANIELEGAVPLQLYNQNIIEGTTTSQALPLQLLGSGNHFDDMSRLTRRQRERESRNDSRELLPRERMLLSVVHQQLQRPSVEADGRNN